MNWGCIPTKFLLHQTSLVSQIRRNSYLTNPGQEIHLDWAKLQQGRRKIIRQLVKGVEFLLNRHKVEVIKGEAHLTSALQVKVRLADGTEKIFTAGNILLATGSRPAYLPFLQPDGQRVLTSRQLLAIEHLPGKLIVIGAGAIGLEMATVFHRLGVEVTVLELLPSILPGAEESLTRRLERILKRQGLKIYTEMRVEKAEFSSQGVILEGYCARTDQSFQEEGEMVLLAIGRRPNLDVLGEVQSKFRLTTSGFLEVDEGFRTNVPGVLAIGDVIGGRLLAHKASHQGIVAVENIAGHPQQFDEEIVPLAVFTEPELAAVGLTEKELIERKIN
jgi:dihydrolipoamide dehydrogenase